MARKVQLKVHYKWMDGGGKGRWMVGKQKFNFYWKTLLVK